MASGTMIQWLALAAKEAREEAGRKIIHIAVMADMDPSTIWRFEQGHWPRDPDLILRAYAEDLDLEMVELWAMALSRWQENGGAAAGKGT